jgi:hypothetical protein
VEEPDYRAALFAWRRSFRSATGRWPEQVKCRPPDAGVDEWRVLLVIVQGGSGLMSLFPLQPLANLIERGWVTPDGWLSQDGRALFDTTIAADVMQS